MSVAVMSSVFWTTFDDLTYYEKSGRLIAVGQSAAKITLLAIADSTNDHGENSWNSYETLAQKTSLARRSVIRAVRALIANGYLISMGSSKFGTNNFTVVLDKLGSQPKARNKAGRPKLDAKKTSDSASETSDSASETSDSESPDPSLSIHNHPPRQQKKLQSDQQTPAEKGNGKVNKDEYLKGIEKSVWAHLNTGQADYAQYPEDVRPVLDRMERLWHLRAPARGRKKGGSYAMWIDAARELLDACGEFGVELLDALRQDWEQYNRENNGLAPHTVSSPRSLVSSASGKAALLRQGITVSQWASKSKSENRQSMLDV